MAVLIYSRRAPHRNENIGACRLPSVEYDEIGIWSEVKLAIIKEHAAAYATILEAQRRDRISSLKWLYIDAYAGPGLHLSKTTGGGR